MKVKNLIKILEDIENKERYIQILVGDEEKDYFASEHFDLMHTDDAVRNCRYD